MTGTGPRWRHDLRCLGILRGRAHHDPSEIDSTLHFSAAAYPTFPTAERDEGKAATTTRCDDDDDDDELELEIQKAVGDES